MCCRLDQGNQSSKKVNLKGWYLRHFLKSFLIYEIGVQKFWYSSPWYECKNQKLKLIHEEHCGTTKPTDNQAYWRINSCSVELCIFKILIFKIHCALVLVCTFSIQGIARLALTFYYNITKYRYNIKATIPIHIVANKSLSWQQLILLVDKFTIINDDQLWSEFCGNMNL